MTLSRPGRPRHALCRSLDIKYAEEVGAAVSRALKQDEGSASTAAAGGTAAEQLKVTHFVQSALAKQSARAPLQGTATTLAQAIDSPSADLRRMVSPKFGTVIHDTCDSVRMHAMRPCPINSCTRMCFAALHRRLTCSMT